MARHRVSMTAYKRRSNLTLPKFPPSLLSRLEDCVNRKLWVCRTPKFCKALRTFRSLNILVCRIVLHKHPVLRGLLHARRKICKTQVYLSRFSVPLIPNTCLGKMETEKPRGATLVFVTWAVAGVSPTATSVQVQSCGGRRDPPPVRHLSTESG